VNSQVIKDLHPLLLSLREGERGDELRKKENGDRILSKEKKEGD
jgi:hypothetical protein